MTRSSATSARGGCGEKRLIKNRDKTKHIARETIAALMGREVLDELTIV